MNTTPAPTPAVQGLATRTVTTAPNAPARLDAPVVAATDTVPARPPRPRATRWPFWACCLLACVMMFADYLFLLPLGLLGNRVVQAGRVPELALTAIGGPVVTLTALLWCRLATRWQLRSRLRAIGWLWTRASAPLLGLGILASAATMTVAQALVLGLGLPHRTDPLVALHYSHPGQAVLPLLTVVSSGFLVQALPEELVWRGWLMHCLAHRPRLALTVSVLVFATMHLASSGGQQGLVEHLLYCVQAGGFAFLAGALALRLRSLWVAVGVHGGLHLMSDLLPQTALRCDGPVMWVVQGAVMVAAGLLVLRGWQGERVGYVR